MAKKSTKTTKKKTTAKKKTGAAKSTATKAKPKKKAVKKTAAKKTAAPKTAAKKAAPRKKKLTVKDLLKKSFDRWQPDTLFAPPKDEAYEKGFVAPPFVTDDAMREVINRKFDFDFAAVAEPPKPKRTLKELMNLTFERWQPATYYTPPEDAASAEGFAATPFVTDDAMREVLTRKFDIDFEAVAKPPKPKRTLKELMNLTFDRWTPASYYEPPKDEAYEKGFTAPPFVKNVTMRSVLNRKFDIDFESVAKPPKPKRTLEELMNLTFDRWTPASYYEPPKDEAKGFAAPPFVADDAMREVLTRKFDFDFAEEFAKAEAIRKAEEERLAAERKAEEERLAAEEAARLAKIKEEADAEMEKMKAEAEKKDKARIKALEEGEASSVEPPSGVTAAEADPMEKAIKFLVAALVILFTIITAASYTNSSKFYLVPKGDALQVWKGHFSPLGKAKVATLHGVPAPEVIKPIYTKAEAYTLAFDYFLNQADELLKADAPNVNELKAALEQASVFAFTDDYQQAVQSRMTQVHLMNFLFKSDAAALKGSLADLEQALAFLEEAALLPLADAQAQLVEQKINVLRSLIESADAEQAAAIQAEEKTEEKIEAEKPAADTDAPKAEEAPAVEAAPAHKATA